MSLTLLQTLSTTRLASAAAIAAVLCAVTLHEPAVAQPSPPEATEPANDPGNAQEARSAQQDAVADDSNAGAQGAKSGTTGEAVQKSSSKPGDADDRARQAELPGSEAAEVNKSDDATAPAEALQSAPQGAAADAAADKPAAGPAEDGAQAAAGQPDGEGATDAGASAASPSEPTTAEKPESKVLTVATWPGAFGEAQRDVVIAGFKAARSIAVDVIERKSKDPIDLSAAAGSALPDAAEFSGDELDAGCKAGQLVKLDTAGKQVIAPANAEDFMPGSLKPCGIGAFAWSHILVVNPNAFDEAKPASLADAFDTNRFPGKRAFIENPRFLMEAALMADGARPGEIYGLLGSDEGRKRAFAKLDSIRKDILWFDNAKATMRALAKGEAAVGQSFSGRAFFSAARGRPVEIIWDGQIYAMTYWAIAANSPRQQLARAFLEFATEPKQLAAVAERFPYGPTRTSAIALTERHLTVDLDLKAYLPTAPGNMENALAADEAWWADNREVMDAAFAEWMGREAAGRPAIEVPEKKPD